MSKQLFNLVLIGALLALSLSQVFAQGARVVLMLHNQQKISGRLLAVRDSALVISTKKSNDRQIDRVIVIPQQDIRRVIIKGKSASGVGVGLGLALGVGIGIAVGGAAGDDPACGERYLTPCVRLDSGAKQLLGGFLGGAAGMALGSLVEFAASRRDRIIYPRNDHDFSALKPFAQFPEQEPDYLNVIQ